MYSWVNAFSFKKYMREKIHYLKFCMSCSAGQAGHLASPLPPPSSQSGVCPYEAAGDIEPGGGAYVTIQPKRFMYFVTELSHIYIKIGGGIFVFRVMICFS